MSGVLEQMTTFISTVQSAHTLLVACRGMLIGTLSEVDRKFLDDVIKQLGDYLK